MNEERFDQICNHVVEEFVDLGQTSFATKKELCEVIIMLLDRVDSLRRGSEEPLHRLKMENLRHRLTIVCLKIERDIASGKITAEEAGIPIKPYELDSIIERALQPHCDGNSTAKDAPQVPQV